MPSIRITIEPRDLGAQTLRRESVLPVPDDGLIVLQLPTEGPRRSEHARFITAAGLFIAAVRDEGRLDAALFDNMADLYDELSNTTEQEA